MNNEDKNEVARKIVEQYIKESEERFQESLIKDGKKSNKSDKVVGDYTGCKITVTYPGDVAAAEGLANLARFRLLDDSENGYDRWALIQEYIEARNNDEVPRDIDIEYSIKLASKRAARLATYNDEGLKLTVHFDANKAVGHTNAANDSIRLPVEHDGILITSTHIGTDPYTHERIRKSSRQIDRTKFQVDGKIYPDAYNKHQEFWNQFGSTRLNFDGKVHKKSSGQDPTGHLSPDSDYTRKFEHDTPIEILPNVSTRLTGRVVKFKQFGGLQEDREIINVSRVEDCECGCNYKVKDLMRGEIVCPQCGLVHGRAVDQ